MKNRMIACALLIIALLVAGCGGRVDDQSMRFVERTPGDARTVQQIERTPPAPQYQLLAAGDFSGNDYRLSGSAAYVWNGSATMLRLHQFQAEQRLGMRLYLASDATGAQHIDLGPLKGYSGTYEYMIPAGTDVSSYDHVVVWSMELRKPLGAAQLQ